MAQLTLTVMKINVKEMETGLFWKLFWFLMISLKGQEKHSTASV